MALRSVTCRDKASTPTRRVPTSAGADVKCWASTFLSLWCALAAAEEPSPSPTPSPTPMAHLEGFVLERGSDRPLSVEITVDDQKFISDGSGHFAFELAPGSH